MKQPAWYDQLIFFASHTTMSQREIAERLNKAEQTVCNVLKKPEIATRVESERAAVHEGLLKDVNERQAKLIEKAYRMYEDMLTDTEDLKPLEKRQIAFDVLKGFGVFTEKREVENTNTERKEMVLAVIALLDDETVPKKAREALLTRLEEIADGRDNPS